MENYTIKNYIHIITFWIIITFLSLIIFSIIWAFIWNGNSGIILTVNGIVISFFSLILFPSSIYFGNHIYKKQKKEQNEKEQEEETESINEIKQILKDCKIELNLNNEVWTFINILNFGFFRNFVKINGDLFTTSDSELEIIGPKIINYQLICDNYKFTKHLKPKPHKYFLDAIEIKNYIYDFFNSNNFEEINVIDFKKSIEEGKKIDKELELLFLQNIQFYYHFKLSAYFEILDNENELRICNSEIFKKLIFFEKDFYHYWIKNIKNNKITLKNLLSQYDWNIGKIYVNIPIHILQIIQIFEIKNNIKFDDNFILFFQKLIFIYYLLLSQKNKINITLGILEFKNINIIIFKILGPFLDLNSKSYQQKELHNFGIGFLNELKKFVYLSYINAILIIEISKNRIINNWPKEFKINSEINYHSPIFHFFYLKEMEDKINQILILEIK